MWDVWVAAMLGGVLGAASVLAFEQSWARARERAARPDIDLGEGIWSLGLHELHCREDRCVYGCDCPCHRLGVAP